MDSGGGGKRPAAPNRWRYLVEHIQDAVVEFELVDGRPVIREVNQSFVETFAYEYDELIGSPLNEYIVPEWRAEEAATLDERTAAGEINYKQVSRETGEGLREFLYRGIPYEDETARIDGFAVYTDLTDVNRRERQLQVLNRVMRHNIQNSANAIAGHTARLLDRFREQRDELTGVAATVEEAAHDLETLAREARQIRAVVAEPAADDPTVDCVPIVRKTVREYRRTSPSADVDADLPDSAAVQADDRLQFGIESLVDNAIEHNPADEPRVRIVVESAGAEGWADVYVDDDGPAIPTPQREIVAGEREITQLHHGSGLGLWLAKWTAERFGGELSFETSDMGGNRVRIRLRRPG